MDRWTNKSEEIDELLIHKMKEKLMNGQIDVRMDEETA